MGIMNCCVFMCVSHSGVFDRMVHNSGKPFKELTQGGFCKKQRVHNTAKFLWKWKEDSGSKFEQQDRGHTLKSILVFLFVFRHDS